jgi:predicted nicotinamide N-methyase
MTTDYEDAVAVGGLSVRLLRPSEPEELFAVAAEARGDAPYWAELWPCARALAAHLATMDLTGVRIVELGCGLALPSLVAALRGADVVASDYSTDALERVAESGRRTLGRPLETLRADLHAPAALIERGPFDLVLGADLLYDCTLAESMGALIPLISPAALFAYAWKRSAIPLAAPLVAHGYSIAQWRPGAKGPRLLEAVRAGYG